MTKQGAGSTPSLPASDLGKTIGWGGKGINSGSPSSYNTNRQFVIKSCAMLHNHIIQTMKNLINETVYARGGQLLQSAGQMWEKEVLGGPHYCINSIQYLNLIFIH